MWGHPGGIARAIAQWWDELSPRGVFVFVAVLVTILDGLARKFGFFGGEHDDVVPLVVGIFAGVFFALGRAANRKTVRWYRGDNGELVLQQRGERGYGWLPSR